MAHTLNLKKLIHFFAIGFGAGLFPMAPGTVGTLVAVPIYCWLQTLPFIAYGSFLVIAFIVGIWLCGETARALGAADPGAIVWDEMVGFWITMIMVPPGWVWIGLGFLLFRFFDVVKPWPIAWIDQHVKGGLGIMLDDVAAAIYAAITLQIVAAFLI